MIDFTKEESNFIQYDSIGDRLKDMGKGALKIGAAFGLAYLAKGCYGNVTEMLRANAQAGGHPPPIMVYTFLHSPDMVLGMFSLGSLVSGVADIIGYDLNKKTNQEKSLDQKAHEFFKTN